MIDGRTVTYDRPVEATLIVRLANGDEWEAEPKDVHKFGLDRMLDVYIVLIKLLEVLGLETEGRHSSLRYLIERTIMYPADAGLQFDPTVPEDHEDWPVLENVRRGLAAWPKETIDDD
jgi:hypothetical protein